MIRTIDDKYTYFKAFQAYQIENSVKGRLIFLAKQNVNSNRPPMLCVFIKNQKHLIMMLQR